MKGKQKSSAQFIVNRLRWEYEIEDRYMGFKISNDHAPMLARQLMLDDPRYENFFDMRETPKNIKGTM